MMLLMMMMSMMVMVMIPSCHTLYVPLFADFVQENLIITNIHFQFSYQDPSSVMGGASLMSGNSLRWNFFGDGSLLLSKVPELFPHFFAVFFCTAYISANVCAKFCSIFCPAYITANICEQKNCWICPLRPHRSLRLLGVIVSWCIHFFPTNQWKVTHTHMPLASQSQGTKVTMMTKGKRVAKFFKQNCVEKKVLEPKCFYPDNFSDHLVFRTRTPEEEGASQM